MNAYYLTAERLGVDILYDTEVSSLNMDDGSVRSVDITYRGFPETVQARCVVASSGGLPGQPGVDARILGRCGRTISSSAARRTTAAGS